MAYHCPKHVTPVDLDADNPANHLRLVLALFQLHRISSTTSTPEDLEKEGAIAFICDFVARCPPNTRWPYVPPYLAQARRAVVLWPEGQEYDPPPALGAPPKRVAIDFDGRELEVTRILANAADDTVFSVGRLNLTIGGKHVVGAMLYIDHPTKPRVLDYFIVASTREPINIGRYNYPSIHKLVGAHACANLRHAYASYVAYFVGTRHSNFTGSFMRARFDHRFTPYDAYSFNEFGNGCFYRINLVATDRDGNFGLYCSHVAGAAPLAAAPPAAAPDGGPVPPRAIYASAAAAASIAAARAAAASVAPPASIASASNPIAPPASVAPPASNPIASPAPRRNYFFDPPPADGTYTFAYEVKADPIPAIPCDAPPSVVESEATPSSMDVEGAESEVEDEAAPPSMDVEGAENEVEDGELPPNSLGRALLNLAAAASAAAASAAEDAARAAADADAATESRYNLRPRRR